MMVSQGAGLIYTLKQNRIVMSVVDHCAVVLNAAHCHLERPHIVILNVSEGSEFLQFATLS